ncbi:formyl peptide receptor 2-like [Pholidichthys leucotaenia]
MFPNSSKPGHVPKSSTDDALNHLSVVIYILTVVLGITGNAVVIWVAGFKLKPKVTNVWLVNLAIADFIFCITRIFSLVKKLFLDHWPFGTFICKFVGFFKYNNMFCSVFLLAVISLDRVLCVWQPVMMKRRRTLCAAKVVVVCVWIAATLFSTPYFIHRKVYEKNNVTECSVDPKEKDNNSTKIALYIIRFLCGFIFPFMAILICYILAGIGIRRTRLSRKSRPLRILAALVIAFFLCWAPYHLVLLVRLVDIKNAMAKTWYPVASALAYFNSCMNPVLYFFMGLEVRKCFKQSLMGIYKQVLAEDEEDHTTQSNVQTLDGTSESQNDRERSQIDDVAEL